ncbi:MAG: arylesterase [Pseudomonadota bacterium]|nr:arylesterase [Pseudomonadota bacterium]
MNTPKKSRHPHHLVRLSLLAGAILGSSAVSAQTIMILGDSISAGYGMDVQQGWVNKLQQRLNQTPYKAGQYTVINASMSGETTSGGLSRLPSLLDRHRPQVLVIELGGNDGLRGQPPKLIEQNLSKMVQLGKDQNAKVVLLGMKIPPNYGTAYSTAFENVFPKIATQHRVPLMPFFLEGVAGQTGMMQSDRIHPTAEAQTKLLNNAWPVIRQVLK